MAATSNAGLFSSAAATSPQGVIEGLPAAVSHAGGSADLHGFGAVPQKLVKKILAKDYVDIWELLPESWQVEMEACCHAKRPRRSLVTDISVWTECYATMAAILSSAYPEKAPHLFSYLRIITKASRTFEGPAWASYDMAFRRQAANRGSLDWGTVDAALYSEAFAGRAKAIPRCRYCLADTHPSPDCPHALTEGQTPQSQMAERPGRSTPRASRSSASVEICRLYNAAGGSRCRFPQCRYAHVCARCRRPHSASECGDRRPRAATPPRSMSPGAPPPPPPTV